MRSITVAEAGRPTARPTWAMNPSSIRISVGPATESLTPSNNLAHVNTVFAMTALSPAEINDDYTASHARVATTSASTPVRSVGWRTGGNCGLWFTGSSFSRFAAFAFA